MLNLQHYQEGGTRTAHAAHTVDSHETRQQRDLLQTTVRYILPLHEMNNVAP